MVLVFHIIKSLNLYTFDIHSFLLYQRDVEILFGFSAIPQRVVQRFPCSVSATPD